MVRTMMRALSILSLLFCVSLLLPLPVWAGHRGDSISFTTEDGVTLRGHPFGTGDRVVILAHMFPTDQTSWFPFARTLAERGFQALTFDFRGYGESGGSKEVALIDRDVRAAVEFVKREGAKGVFLIGASMGGTASLKVAAAGGVDGVASLSGPSEWRGLSVEGEISKIRVPTLFIASEDDSFTRGVREQHQKTRAPKQLKVFPGDAHGTFLFHSPHKAAVEKILLDFLAERTK